MTFFPEHALGISARFPRDFDPSFAGLTSLVPGSLIDPMEVRWKEPQFGDRVRVKNADMYFQLPSGLPEGTETILVGRQSGRYIVRALGREWDVPLQCIDHEEEVRVEELTTPDSELQKFPRILIHFRGKKWAPRSDRRVQKAEAVLKRIRY